MKKMRAVLKNALVALNQFGIEYATNIHGFGATIVKQEDVLDFIQKNSAQCITWSESPDAKAAIQNWLTTSSLDGRELGKPAGYMASALSDADRAVIILSRSIKPNKEDFEAFATGCGCSSFEEAQTYYGDMSWDKRRFLAIYINGRQLEDFLELTVPYCWG